MDWSEFSLEPVETSLTRPIGTNPYVPDDSGDRDRRCREILHIAALGLKKRLVIQGPKSARGGAVRWAGLYLGPAHHRQGHGIC